MSEAVINIGVDLGGTDIKFGVIDENGTILARARERTNAHRGSRAIIDSIVNGIDSVLLIGGLRVEQINAIGLGVPGTADSKNGVVVFAPNIFWRDIEIVHVIRQAFNIPVHIAQDTRAAVWAEFLVGSGIGFRSLACISIGTGIGCGMVFDGKIFHGGLNTAGEFGHQLVELNGDPCNCGRRGCLEAYAGGLAIVKQAIRQIRGIHELLQKDATEITAQDVFGLARAGNAEALRLTNYVVEYIGMGLVNLVNLNSVELICISGGISNAPEELLLTPLITFVRNRAYEPLANKVHLCKSLLHEDAPMVGAALLYKEIQN